MIRDFLDTAGEDGRLKKSSDLHPTQLDSTAWKTLTDNSFFLGYKDIEAAIARVTREPNANPALDDLGKQLLNFGRATTLGLYKKAFRESDDRSAVEQEFLPLVQMAVGEGLDDGSKYETLNLKVIAEEFRGPSEDQEKAPLIYADAVELRSEAAKHVRSRNA